MIAIAAAVLFGLAPGPRMLAGNLQEVLKDGGHGLSEGRMTDALDISDNGNCSRVSCWSELACCCAAFYAFWISTWDRPADQPRSVWAMTMAETRRRGSYLAGSHRAEV